jgi:hypothetical protein
MINQKFVDAVERVTLNRKIMKKNKNVEDYFLHCNN